MSNQLFAGFPEKMNFTPIPNLFFSRLLPEIDDPAELKVTLHVFFRQYPKRGPLKFVSYSELAADATLLDGLGDDSQETLRRALKAATARGAVATLTLYQDNLQEEIFFVNSPANKRAAALLTGNAIPVSRAAPPEPHNKQERPNIFAQYEQNIGLLTPLIADELKDAEQFYPAAWIEEAFREAVALNKRSWRYIARILENWAAEGKRSGESGKYTQGKKDPDRYIKGKYGHVVKR